VCGICGIIHCEADRPVNQVILRSMNNAMIHRGPDDDGYHLEPGVGLAMRRLAIIDLAGGQQPMSNEDGSIWVVFNGEIYNHVEIRKRLAAKGHILRTSCDTEVLTHLYEDEGDRFPEFLNGMFAIALWDRTKRRLLLVRDRIGIKPIYIACIDGTLVFASEIRAVIEHPEVSREIDLMAFSEYLTFEHTIPPRTMLAEVRKLPAGHMAVYEQGKLKVREYWDLRFPEVTAEDLGEQVYVERFREMFVTSVNRRLMSDVPVGVFLSGGVDSSAIVAMMSQLGVPEKRTYALGYPEGDLYGELSHASIVAKHFRTHHEELIISSQDYIEAMPSFILHIDDPISDEAGPLFMLLAKRARQDVTVILCGQGADETLGGYTLNGSQRRFDRLRRFQRLPRWLRCSVPTLIGPLLPGNLREWLARGNRDIASINAEEIHTLAWQFEPEDKRRFCPVLNEVDEHCPEIVREAYKRCDTKDPLRQILYVYIKIALAETLLMYGDKMTMAHSVELRVPFLDHELVELVAQIPSRYIVRHEPDGSYTTKSILKRAMHGILPDAILNRPKAAFPIPLKEWFQGALASYCRNVLLSDSARTSGYYDTKQVEMLLDSHCRTPTTESTLQIKNLLFFEMWRQLVLSECATDLVRELGEIMI
jgi:asparagine synthase (glutamine-hydrolysing)